MRSVSVKVDRRSRYCFTEVRIPSCTSSIVTANSLNEYFRPDCHFLSTLSPCLSLTHEAFPADEWGPRHPAPAEGVSSQQGNENMSHCGIESDHDFVLYCLCLNQTLGIYKRISLIVRALFHLNVFPISTPPSYRQDYSSLSIPKEINT